MLTSYEVGAVYRIVDQATPTLIKIAGALEKIAGLSKQAEAHFSGLGAVKIGGLNKSLGTLESRLGGVAEKAAVAREGMVTAFGRADASIAATTGAVGKLTAELAAARREASGLRLPGSGGGGGRHPRPGQGGSGGGSGGGSRGHGSASSAGHTGVQLGVMGFFGAEAVGHGLKEVLKEAGELEHIQQQMIQAGFKETEIAKARAAAWREAQRYGINVSKVLGDIKELTLPLGSIEHAIDFIEPLEKMRLVLNAVSEGKGNSAAEAVYKMARAGELKGLQTPEEFESYFNNMTKAISASGGKVTPNDFMQFAKYGKLSTMGFNEEFFTKYAPTLIQTMGASTAGTSLQSLFGTLVQGTVTKRAIGRMEDLGLIGDPSKLVFDNKGDPKGFNPGAIIGTETLVKNPFEWAQKFLLPLLEKKYGSLDVAENKQKAIEDLGGLFGNRNSAAAIAELALRGKTFQKDAGLIEQAQGIGGADRLLKEDPKLVAEKLHGAWTNLMTALGGPGVKVAVDGMNAVAGGLTALTKWAQEHPAAVKVVLSGMLGLAGGFVALTAAGVAAGAALLGTGGAVAVAVTTLVSVMGSIAAFHWEEVKGIGAKITEALMAPVNAILNVWEKIKGFFGGMNPALVTPGSYEGEGIGAMIHRASFGGGANDNFGGASGVARALGRGGLGGAGRGSGGLGGAGGGTGGGSGGGAGLAHARGVLSRANPEMVAYIRESAIRNGINPDIALRIAASEGLGGSIPGVRMTPGDRGTSFGPFQLHYGGRGSLGTEYSRATGHHAGDPRYWKEQIDFALRYAGRNRTWAPWFGRGPAGVGTHEGFGYKGKTAPTAGPPPKPAVKQPIMVDLHMDGKKMGRAIAMHQADDHLFPKKAGGMDTHGDWRAPGTPVTDAA